MDKNDLNKGRILIVSGPSGIGKSYLANELTTNFDYQRITPITTREPRTGEKDGVDYNFVDEDLYELFRSKGDLFMSNDIFGKKYGFQYSEVEKIFDLNLVPVTEIYVPAVEQILNVFPDSDTIFLYPKTIEIIRERMRKRGDSEEVIEKRIKSAQEEIAFFDAQGYIHYDEVITIEGDKDIEKILEVISSLRAKQK